MVYKNFYKYIYFNDYVFQFMWNIISLIIGNIACKNYLEIFILLSVSKKLNCVLFFSRVSFTK